MLKRTVLPVRLAVAAIAVAALVAAPFSAQTARAAVNPPQALPADSTGTVAEGGNPTRTNDFSAQTFLPAGSVVVSVANTTRGITTSSVAGGGFGIELRPPAHQPLRVGTYDLRGNGNGIPGAASKPSLGGFDGHLDIIDLASNAQGLFTRFDIVLQGVGEIRMGEGDNTPLTFGARHILFNDAAVGVAPAYSRETLQNTGAAAVSLGSIGVTGRSASSFAVSSNTCSETLAAHAQCQFEIGFAPRSGGPQDAQVTVPVAGQAQTVEVAGNGLLGKTSLVTTGADTLDGGATHTYASGPLVPSVLRYLDGWSWQWANAYDVGANRATANFDAPAGARLAVGTHATGNFYPIAGPARYGTNVSLESEGCLYTHGSETVKSFALGGNGLPTSADITFTQYCEADTTPMTGTLLWQARSDVTAPLRPTAVKVTAAAATWTKSASKDSTTTIARLVEGSGAHATPSSGYALYSGTGRSAAMPALRSGQEYTVVLFSVDSTGNISVAATKSIGTTATIVTAPSAPTIISAVAGDGSVTVAFTPPAKDGNSPVTSYTVKNLNGLQTVTGASSPLTLTGLKDGFGVRTVVYANNAAGSGDPGGAPVVEPITTVTPSMPQLLSDPGFEQGDSGWTPFFSGDAAQPQAVLSRVSSPVHGGSGALKVAASTQPDASSVGIRNDTAIVHAVGGGTYTASCWVRPTSTVDVSATLQDSTRTLYTTHWVAPAGKWTKVSVESLEMWTGENVTPVFSTSATTATGPVYFDDCSVTR